ncbi:MAG: CBS domain-containing protein [Pseudomonadota bacterium]
MPKIEIEQHIKAHADVVWKVISDLDHWDNVAPNVSKVEMLGTDKPGLARRIYDNKGRTWVEKLTAWEEGRGYTMEVDTSDPEYAFPFDKMRGIFTMQDRRGTIIINMRFEYSPKYGPIGRLLDRFQFIPRFKALFREAMHNWIRQIYAREWAYRVTVANLIKDKGGKVFSVAPETSIIDAANILRQNRIGSVMVLSPEGRIVGVVSERDIVRGISDYGGECLQHPVKDIMTEKVVVCEPDYNMVLVMACMTDRRIRHLPVMEGDKCIGVISIGDVVRARIEELENESKTMREYIKGRRWRELFMQIGPAAYEREKRQELAG